MFCSERGQCFGSSPCDRDDDCCGGEEASGSGWFLAQKTSVVLVEAHAVINFQGYPERNRV